MTDHPRVVLAPDLLAGKPVIRGTRLAVEFLIGLMADGWSEADILQNYPGITHDDVLACLAYPRDMLSAEKLPDVRFLADENFPGAAIAAIAAAGHDIVWVRTIAPGTSDPAVLAWAAREQRTLLTFDKDFGELAGRSALPRACGVVLLRVPMPRLGDLGQQLGWPLLRHRARPRPHADARTRRCR